MATFKTLVRTQRKDGFFPVYIRVVHRTKPGYIKTDKCVTKHELTKTGEIKDPYVLDYCIQRIKDYNTRLNMVNIANWSVQQIIAYLQEGDEDLCFSDYARKHIDRLIDSGQARNAKNYELALRHMERYFGTTKVRFSQLTSANMTGWIRTMEQTRRAKEMYPVCMRQVFRAAIAELNDYDLGHIRIKTNPWIKVRIPQADRPGKRAISAEDCAGSFLLPCPKASSSRPCPSLGATWR